MSELPGYALPDCSAADHCPEIELDSVWCTSDPSLFEVTMFGDLVADIDMVEVAVAGSGLPTGQWHTIFPDPTGGCKPTVVTFDVFGGAE